MAKRDAGSRIVPAGKEISTEKLQSGPPGDPLIVREAVERATVESIATRMKATTCAFDLSGGTQGTLLAVLATRHRFCEVTASTA